MTLATTLFPEELDRRIHDLLITGQADDVQDALYEALQEPFPGYKGTRNPDLFARLSEALEQSHTQPERVSIIRGAV